MKQRTGIDLFAGAGGFSRGVEKAGFNVLAAVEFDKWAAQTYRLNHKGTLLVEEDIRKIKGRDLLRAVGLKEGELDLLFGGPPCQGFTIVNTNRSLDDPRSKLMNEFVRMVKEIHPRAFYIENVPGCFAYRDFFMFLMETLENCYYKVRCLMLNAYSYGVPQDRMRIFIQGIREDLGYLPSFPPPENFDPKQLKVPKNGIFCQADVAIEAFAVNGFPKEEVKDLYWNEKLSIQMNRKTAGDVIERALGSLVGKALQQHIKERQK